MKFLKNILLHIGALVGYIYSFRFSNYFLVIRIYIYTGWLRRYFKKFGNSTIRPYARLLKGLEYISVGDNSVIGNNIQLTAWDKHQMNRYTPEIIIGDGVSIGEDAHITAINKIHIGNNVLLGKKVLITDNSHGEFILAHLDTDPKKRPLFSKGSVIIEDNVWIGEKVSIMANVRIGKCSIIAANSVVTKDIPSYSLAAGIPAKIIKQLK